MHHRLIPMMLGSTVFLLQVLSAWAKFFDCLYTDNVQLVNGGDRCSGTVLLKWGSDRYWARVCDNNWDMKDAAVVCRQLGCGAPISATRGSFFPTDKNTAVQITDVQCEGSELSIRKCPLSEDIPGDCDHGRDAGVQCTGPDDLRLVNGPTPCSGRVEIRHNRVWGSVCADSWDESDARVVCRQLGCGLVQEYGYNATFGKSSLPFVMSDVQCHGDEAALWRCEHGGWTDKTCPSGRDAGVVCTGGADEIRLVNTGDACSGRVEIKHENRWGTVCGIDWGKPDADVVCRELGCGSASRATFIDSPFGEGTWPVWLSNVQCTGTESSLKDCPHAAWGHNDCSFRRDSGVFCTDNRKLDPTVYKESLFLDLLTAHPALEISANGKRMKGLAVPKTLPNNGGRFEKAQCVLGSVGFTTGKHYWEVAVTLDSTKLSYFRLSIGVMEGSVNWKTTPLAIQGPCNGLWTLIMYLRTFKVATYPKLKARQIKGMKNIGVYLDFEGGLLSFYNADSQEHLFTYTDVFTEKLFPVFCIYDKSTMKLN